MAVNFRLAVREGIEYTDLFPKLEVSNITDLDNALHYQVMNVEIPVVSTMTQDITIATTPELVAAPVRMFPIENTELYMNAYNTISQFEVLTNTLRITRLSDMPTTGISVTLVFYLKGASL